MYNSETKIDATIKIQGKGEVSINDEKFSKINEEISNLTKKVDALANPQCPIIAHHHGVIQEYASIVNFITAISVPGLLKDTDFAHLTPFFAGAAVGSATSYALAPSIETVVTPWLIEFYKNNIAAVIGTAFSTVSIIMAQGVKSYLQNPGNPDDGNPIGMMLGNFDNKGITAAVSTVLLGASMLSSAGGAEQTMSCITVDIALKIAASGLAAAGANILYTKIMPNQQPTLSDGIIGGLVGQAVSTLSWYVHEGFSASSVIGYLLPFTAMAHKLYTLNLDVDRRTEILEYKFLPAAAVIGSIMFYKAVTSVPKQKLANNTRV